MDTRKKNTQKLLLVLPVLVLPFLALAFYALGGGRQSTSDEDRNADSGINTTLPDAQFKNEDPLDKLSLYELTKRDSSGLKKQFGQMEDAEKISVPAIAGKIPEDPNEQEINEKLAQIDRELNRKVVPSKDQNPVTVASAAQTPSMKGDVDRLERLMQSIQEEKEEDPEMRQLSEMLDKIITIQNPAPENARPDAEKKAPADSQFRAVPARIVSDQKAVQGATIRLQLQDSIHLEGVIIPAGHEIFGICRITNQRLLLDVRNIRLGMSIIPVDLSVYSLDGMAGINAPEAVLGDAASSGADDAIRSVGMYGIDQSIATQVAGAGIDAAKNMFSKQLRKVKVKLKAGQPVLLRNNKLR
ncbi:conjugative transposon TraM protein [Arcticibacter tournemirensis]|uniref:Conjugative transposon protein TraM n=1 Tax=Arcticibacter tournemirensis TaxID=699437 RepID=A0A5M9GZJ5_9SPHI|nr:conjugative transposon protein TraM [Arcticibacter tournemirensis]KAA8480076.1 conjugative transposon protein TraM [Arcticibacter tournemirensis]TQM50678.1 conjugative transposon TraM protein [Arcticibacter tournemirensis]